MAEQPEARDIGQRVHAGLVTERDAGSIQLRRAGDHRRIPGSIELLLLQRGAIHTDAERLAEHQCVAGLRTSVAFQVAWIDEADGDQPVDRLDRIDRVTAGDRDAGARTHRLAAFENLADRVHRQLVDRHADQRQCEQRRAAHRVDVRDGIGCRDRAEIEGVVDDRHEEVGRRDDRLRVIDPVDRRVVRRLDADQQLLGQQRGP
jgi:hypothetical protein